MKINFSTKKAYEDTVDINDLKLIEKVNLENIKKNKLSFKEKYNVKAILISIIIVFIILFFSTSYVLNRNCPVGEVNKNGICVSGYYYCDTGYLLNEDNKCQKTIETIDAKTSYTCPSGYVLQDEAHCVSKKQVEMQMTYECLSNDYVLNEKAKKCELTTAAAVQYTCPSGYDAVGTKCVSVSTVNATSSLECEDSSYTLSGNLCKKNITKIENAEMSYVCNTGGTLNGTVCDYAVKPTNFWFGYGQKCSRGTYSSTDNMCHYSESARMNLGCREGGVLNINKCHYTVEDVKNAVEKYSCPSGYVVSGNYCAKNTGIEGTPKYTCPKEAKLKGNKCVFSSDAIAVYKCPTGYITTGVNCVLENIPVPVKKYTCSKVYTLNGDKCEKYETIKAKTHYN